MHQNSWNPSKHHERPSWGASTTNIDELDIVACHRLGSTDRTIMKLLYRKDAVKLLENKNKLKYADL